MHVYSFPENNSPGYECPQNQYEIEGENASAYDYIQNPVQLPNPPTYAEYKQDGKSSQSNPPLPTSATGFQPMFQSPQGQPIFNVVAVPQVYIMLCYYNYVTLRFKVFIWSMVN